MYIANVTIHLATNQHNKESYDNIILLHSYMIVNRYSYIAS